MRERAALLSLPSAEEHHVYTVGDGVAAVSEVCCGATREQKRTLTDPESEPHGALQPAQSDGPNEPGSSLWSAWKI